MPDYNTDPMLRAFAHGELTLHHRAGGAGTPITCGAPQGCITAVVEDVQCPSCREAISAAEPAAPR